MRYSIPLIALLALSACSQSADEQGDTYADERAGELVPTPANNLPSGIPDRPVMVGHDGPQMDACGTASKVVLVAGEEGEAAIVRSAPDISAREVARIAPGHMVTQCDYSDENVWLGIVWDPGNPESPNCGTGSPVAEVQEYAGTCQPGWIRADNLEMIAG